MAFSAVIQQYQGRMNIVGRAELTRLDLTTISNDASIKQLTGEGAVNTKALMERGLIVDKKDKAGRTKSYCTFNEQCAGHGFTRRCDATRHYKEKHTADGWVCPFCPVTVLKQQKSALINHMNTKHCLVPGRVYCEYIECGFNVPDVSAMSRHRKETHNDFSRARGERNEQQQAVEGPQNAGREMSARQEAPQLPDAPLNQHNQIQFGPAAHDPNIDPLLQENDLQNYRQAPGNQMNKDGEVSMDLRMRMIGALQGYEAPPQGQGQEQQQQPQQQQPQQQEEDEVMVLEEEEEYEAMALEEEEENPRNDWFTPEGTCSLAAIQSVASIQEMALASPWA